MTSADNFLRASLAEIRNLEDRKLISAAFKQAAWGLDDTERARTLEEIEQEVRYRSLRNPGLPAVVADSVRNGRKACQLAGKYKKKLAAEGNSEQVQAWRAREVANYHYSVDRHLSCCLKNWQEYQQGRLQRSAKPLSIDIPVIKLNEQGLHPNSLRSLSPADACWDILIDEGGVRFDDKALDADLPPDQIGRFVAIAIADNKQLPPLKADQHAAGGDVTKQQQIVNNMLQSKVGVFGFAVDDPVFEVRSYWMSHVHNLMRWVLLLLPMHSGAPCTVRFFIEQRGSYRPDSELTALREVLENEIKSINPQRYAGLRLELSIIAKDGHPANGYVDAVANLWNSPSGFKKKLLQHTHLLSHCLLNPKHIHSLDRLYLALNRERTLQPEQWYEACAAQVSENEHSLLNDYLAQLGQQVQQQPALWNRYLQQVKQQLAGKGYKLAALGVALEWLQRYCPEGKKLSPVLELQLLAARLSLANHKGQTAPEDLARAFQLAYQLQEENAPLATETLLRLVSSGTNAFQFEQVQSVVEQWLELPVAAPGLLNYGKLRSSLGQLLAFQGKNEQAITHFEQAIDIFGRLSDPEQAAKEQLQTRSYRLCALMDLESLADSSRLQDALAEYLHLITGEDDLNKQVTLLARSGDILAKNFAHHLLLRALISWPQMLQPLRELYLAQAEHWQQGENHPWPLILFYRGWLCLDAGKRELATDLMQQAVYLCEQTDNGPTLQWMGAALRQLATSLEIPELELSTERRRELQNLLPLAAHEVLAQQPSVALSWLHQVLPFNFH